MDNQMETAFEKIMETRIIGFIQGIYSGVTLLLENRME